MHDRTIHARLTCGGIRIRRKCEKQYIWIWHHDSLVQLPLLDFIPFSNGPIECEKLRTEQWTSLYIYRSLVLYIDRYYYIYRSFLLYIDLYYYNHRSLLLYILIFIIQRQQWRGFMKTNRNDSQDNRWCDIHQNVTEYIYTHLLPVSYSINI